MGAGNNRAIHSSTQKYPFIFLLFETGLKKSWNTVIKWVVFFSVISWLTFFLFTWCKLVVISSSHLSLCQLSLRFRNATVCFYKYLKLNLIHNFMKKTEQKITQLESVTSLYNPMFYIYLLLIWNEAHSYTPLTSSLYVYVCVCVLTVTTSVFIES